MGKKNQSKAERKQSQQAPTPKQNSFSARKFLTGVTFRYSILGVLLFLLVAFQAGGSDKEGAIVAVLVLIACSIGKRPLEHLRQRLSIPVLAVCAYLLLNAAAGLYSRFGSFAVGEFGKILTAFCVFCVVIFRGKQGEERPLAAMVAAVTAAFALLSIDASSLQFLTRPFVGFMDLLGSQFANMNIGYETGVRVIGVFGNANVMAGVLAFGVFLSLYLVCVTETRRGRFGACLLLAVNALGFLLSFSMGAIAMFVVAALVYLAAANRGARLPLLLLMVETALVSLIMAFISFSGLGKSGMQGALPVLAALVGGVLLWLIHTYVGERLSALLGRHIKASGIAVAGLAALAVCYIFLAYNLTGGYNLAPGETLRRSVYPDPGTYTLLSEHTGDVSVTVDSQNEAEAIMHKSTVLYAGPLSGAAFTVPGDSMVVYLNLSAAEGAALSAVSLQGGEQVKLGYTLLPGFAANRIQGLWANQNAIQRVVFFRDGLRLYAQSPIIGNGLGSVEGMVTSVQDFFYESRFVHNQYIQVLAEMGIPGLVCFLALLGSVAITLWKRRCVRARDPLLPALIACFAMMALHGGVEAVWSIGSYQSMALLLLAFIAVSYGRPVARIAVKGAAWVASACIWVFTAVFAWLIGGNISADQQYMQIKSGTRAQTPYSMEELAKKDRYNWAQYKLDMAVNAVTSEVPEFKQTAVDYAAQVRRLRIYSINFSLAQYHYLALGDIEQVFEASREGVPSDSSRTSTWQDQFFFYEQIFWPYGAAPNDARLEKAQWYAAQSLLLYDSFVAFNKGRMEQLDLTVQNSTFLGKLMSLKASGASGPQAAAVMEKTLFDSANASDVNSDGIPDLLSATAGALAPSAGGWTAAAGTTINLAAYNYHENTYLLTLTCEDPAAITAVTLDGVPLALTVEGQNVTTQIALPEDMGVARQISISVGADTELSAISLLGLEG